MTGRKDAQFYGWCLIVASSLCTRFHKTEAATHQKIGSKMQYELLEIIGIIWSIGILYLSICLLSQILFGKIGFLEVIRDIFLIWLWPLLFTSPNGRAKLFNLIKLL